MTMNVTMSKHVMGCIRQALGLEFDDTSRDYDIMTMGDEEENA